MKFQEMAPNESINYTVGGQQSSSTKLPTDGGEHNLLPNVLALSFGTMSSY